MKKIIAIILSAFLFISCATTPKQKIEIPEIKYPEFPVDVNDSSVHITLEENNDVKIDYTADNEVVEIPFWFWLRLVSYSIDVDTAIKQYEAVIENLNK